MKTRLTILITLLLCSITVSAEEIVVIVSQNANVDSLNNAQVEQIFLGKSSLMVPYDQREKSEIRAQFYQRATNRNLAQVSSIWSKLLFSGRATKPEQLINSKAIIGAVARDTSGIGYIWKSEVDNTVKVVLELP